MLGLPGSDPKVSSTLHLRADGYVAVPSSFLEPARQLRRSRSGSTHTIRIGGPQDVVDDYLPRTLWGVDDGEPFTLLDAKMGVEADFSQSYDGSQILQGVHVANDEAEVTGVRLTFRGTGDRGWLGEQVHVSEHGELRPWDHDGRPGLEWRPPRPVPLRSLAFRQSHTLPTLLTLWTARNVDVLDLQVQVPGTGWRRVEHLRRRSSASGDRPSDLLPLNELDLVTIDSWLGLASRLGPIPYMAVKSHAVQQTEVLAVAAGLEGLHRRLHPHINRTSEGGRLSGASKNGLRKAGSIATKEVLKQLGDKLVFPEKARNAVRETFGHLEDLSFKERLEILLPAVDQVAPGLLGPDVNDWIAGMVNVRNVQAHGLSKHDDFGEREISQYYVLGASGRWALRIMLLLQVAGPDQVMRALHRSNAFGFTLANIDREHQWADFSAYDAFRTAESS